MAELDEGAGAVSAVKVARDSRLTHELGTHRANGEYIVRGKRVARCGRFPASVFLILGNEFGERFSFYGMRALLIVFLTDFLLMPDGQAITYYHAFISAAYFTPILGGIVSDMLLGRFRTILLLSIVYIAGLFMLAVSAFPWIYDAEAVTRDPTLSIAALMVIALGTGGIKPCVSTFGADQLQGDERVMTTFFHIFYLSINIGSLLSIVITPVIQSYLNFWIAFMVPAGVLTVAMIVFVIGFPLYVRHPPSGSALLTVFKVLFVACRRSRCRMCCCRRASDGGFLRPAADVYGDRVVNDVRALGRVLLIFATLPMFWALYDQQGSRWTLQAKSMNLNVFGIRVPAASVQAINALLILVMAPFVERVIYPAFEKQLNHVRRMSIGMALAALSFFICAVLQLYIDSEPPHTVNVAWQLPQYVVVTAAEILVSITALEFAYAESPPSMKTVVMALSLLTVALGDFIVASTGEVEICGNYCDYLVFGGAMVAFVVLFVLLAIAFERLKRGAAGAPVKYSGLSDDQAPVSPTSDGL